MRLALRFAPSSGKIGTGSWIQLVRVVLDTNILVSALIRRNSIPGRIVQAWLQGGFVLLSHEREIDELRAVTRRPEVRGLLRRAEAGRMVNELRTAAELLDQIPRIRRSDDPGDDFLLAMCDVGEADYLVTGDKRGLLALGRHGRTSIVTARQFLDVIEA
jgi:uncharacterized protein